MARTRPQTEAPLPGRAETLVGVLALAVLVAVAAGVWVAQSRYDPGPFRATSPAASRPGGAGATASGRRHAGAGSGIAPAPDLLSGGRALPPGVRADGAAVRYDAETLHHKINGKADLYLAAGFEWLACGRFRDQADGRCELCVYAMKSPDAAFSVWSRQRRDGATALDLGRHVYSTENAAYAAHGERYLELVSLERSAASAKLRLALLRALMAPRTGGAPGAVASGVGEASGGGPGQGSGGHGGDPGAHAAASGQVADDGFAALGLDCVRPESLVLRAESAFGFEGLDRVMVGACGEGDDAPRLFVSRRADPAEARRLVVAWVAFLRENGAQEVEPAAFEPAASDPAGPGTPQVDAAGRPARPPATQGSGDGAQIRLLAMSGVGEAVFSVGSTVAGVHEAVDLPTAATLAHRLWRHLQATRGGTP